MGSLDAPSGQHRMIADAIKKAGNSKEIVDAIKSLEETNKTLQLDNERNTKKFQKITAAISIVVGIAGLIVGILI